MGAYPSDDTILGYGNPLLRLQIRATQLSCVKSLRASIFRVFGSISLVATSLTKGPWLHSYSQDTIVPVFAVIVSLLLNLHVSDLLAYPRSLLENFSFIDLGKVKASYTLVLQ